MRRGPTRYISINENGGTPRDDRAARRDVPENPPEETERIERLIDRLFEEHRETIEKLGNE
jgi:hypothetical protein